MSNESINDNVIICRCEEITKKEILEAIKNGARTVTMVKKMTRAGMGLCKGRTCSKLIQRIIFEETGIPQEEIDFDLQRAPLRPITIGVLANFGKDDLLDKELCSDICKLEELI